MDRRSLFLGGLAAAAAGNSAAETSCGPQECIAGIPVQLIPVQGCPQWCWAASIQMVFALHGHYVDQRDIVARIYPNLACFPASNAQLFVAATGEWRDGWGQVFTSQAEVIHDPSVGLRRADAAYLIVQELNAGNPLICGAVGHATVVTAVAYTGNPAIGPQIHQVRVRDPWPGAPNPRILTPQELLGTSFLARMRVT